MLITRSGRKASQNEFELNSFINLLKEKSVQSYLEIGARHGDTFHAVMSSLPLGSHGVAMDLPGGLWGKKSSIESLKEAATDLISKGYKIDLIIGNSQSEECIKKAKKHQYDAILIDGDHTLSGVTKDWEIYGGLMSKIVAFHDIVGDGQFEKVHFNPVQVHLLWKSIKDCDVYNFVEFIDADSKMGIGCVLR